MNYSMNGTEQENARMSKDNVNQPDHYTQGGVECIDAITAATLNKTGIEAVCVANAIKYLWRYELKNGLEDVKKAQWYLNRLVAEMDKPVLEEPVVGKQGRKCSDCGAVTFRNVATCDECGGYL